LNVIQLKTEGVPASIKGIQPEILFAVLVAQSIWVAMFPDIPLVITSITDGKHGDDSLHYEGQAIDLRTRNLPNDNSAKLAGHKLNECLGKDYDITIHKTHIHIEYQPK